MGSYELTSDVKLEPQILNLTHTRATLSFDVIEIWELVLDNL